MRHGCTEERTNATCARFVSPSSDLGSDENEIRICREKIFKYRHECGCSTGGVFLVTAFILSVGYFVIMRRWSIPAILAALGFIFVSAIIGKFTGIGIARIKLLLLIRSLREKVNRQI